MTSKRKQLIKIPISIFFFTQDQIPKHYQKIKFEEYSSYSIFISNKEILLNLSKISSLNNLQKNFKLLLIGEAVKNFCKSGNYYVDYFGSKILT